MSEPNNPEGDKTPSGAKGETSEQELTFTQKQVDTLVGKAKSDTLTDYKRLEAEFKRSQSVAEAAIKRLRTIEENQLRAEEEAVRDDPERLSALRMKREAFQAKTEAEELKRQTEQEKTEIQSQRQEILQHHADRFSERYNVDASVLLKYGGASRDSLEDLAKSFGERTEPAGEPQNETTRMKSPPDSGKTKGTGGNRLTRKSLDEYNATGKTTQQIMADSKEILDKFAK